MGLPFTFAHSIVGDRHRQFLLLLHGFMGSRHDWTTIADELKPGYRVLTVDLPGHGETQVTDDSLYRMENCAAGLVGFLDDLKIDRCHLVGYSMGGRLALYMAVHFPERFGSAMIESSSPGLKTLEERRARIEHDDQLAQRLESEKLSDFLDAWYQQPLFATLRDEPDRLREILRSRSKNDPAGLAKSLRFMGTGVQPSLWERLATIKMPLLLVAGADDAKFSGLATEMADLCSSARLCIIQDCGHNVHLERPRQYIEHVKRFLLEHS